jgi:hypothetical protein
MVKQVIRGHASGRAQKTIKAKLRQGDELGRKRSFVGGSLWPGL